MKFLLMIIKLYTTTVHLFRSISKLSLKITFIKRGKNPGKTWHLYHLTKDTIWKMKIEMSFYVMI